MELSPTRDCPDLERRVKKVEIDEKRFDRCFDVYYILLLESRIYLRNVWFRDSTLSPEFAHEKLGFGTQVKVYIL